MSEIIKYSDDKQWLIAEVENKYYFFDISTDKPEAVMTPNNKILETSYYVLAERILCDLERYGVEYMSGDSVIPWHFTMIESFLPMKHEQVEQMLDECFLQKYDWTYEADYEEVFGCPEERIPAIREWLSECTHMQMTAACCIGNAYHSINLAYVMAVLMENYAGKELKEKFKILSAIVEENSFMEDRKSIMRVFETFELYYGIHYEQDGPIINVQLSLDKEESSRDSIAVTEEMLIGRNFYHYTDGERDAEQPFVLETELSYLEDADDEPDEDDEYDEEYDDDDDDVDEELTDYFPDDCWIKKIRSIEDDEEVYYYMVLVVYDGAVQCFTVIRDEVSRSGGGMFFIPGMTMPAEHYYYDLDEEEYPEIIDKEFEALKNKRYLTNNYSFTGKRLPQTILDQGGNGGDMTEHTYAMQSAYRLAYMHMSVSTTEDGISTGIIKKNGKLIIILDFEKIVTDINPETGLKVTEIDDLGERSRSDIPILIAEDSVLLNKLIVDSLKKAGYVNLVRTENGEEAWNFICECKEHDDLEEHVNCVITDIEMPLMDGHRLTKLIKDDEATKHIPVVIFSSLVNDEMRRKGAALGADAQLSKPEIGNLVREIDRLVLNR